MNAKLHLPWSFDPGRDPEYGHIVGSDARSIFEHVRRDYAEPIVAAMNAHDALVAALNGILTGGEAMESILWGDQPDTASVSSTYPLGALRAARAALKLAKVTP